MNQQIITALYEDRENLTHKLKQRIGTEPDYKILWDKRVEVIHTIAKAEKQLKEEEGSKKCLCCKHITDLPQGHNADDCKSCFACHPSINPLTCKKCGVKDETVKKRNCIYDLDVLNKKRKEIICDNCEKQHEWDI